MCALQFVFTVGTVVLGLFVASKVLGVGPGEGGQGQGRGSKGQRWGSGRCVSYVHVLTIRLPNQSSYNMPQKLFRCTPVGTLVPQDHVLWQVSL